MADEPILLDETWLRAHPLPMPEGETDKNARGHVIALGGSRSVPGGILLTAEAALRAGAGKMQIATVASVAIALGIAMPEAGVIALGETSGGEIGDIGALTPELPACDALVAGPAMSPHEAGGDVLDGILAEHADDKALVLDAGALMDLTPRADRLRARALPAILTPHLGEMAAMLGCDAEAIKQDRVAVARRAAEIFGSIVAFKGSQTVVASPDGSVFCYPGGGVGLATGGSGDVLAGIVAGLAARGAPPLHAALWAVWLHGEAGRACARHVGRIGFLARDLPRCIPALMNRAGPGEGHD